MIFGQGNLGCCSSPFFQCIADAVSLRLAYSAADVMVVPSRLDNLPNTATEAMACGTPVVAFRTGGLPEIVNDGITGLLADAFEPEAAQCIAAVVVPSVGEATGTWHSSRQQAEDRWHPKRIAAQVRICIRPGFGAFPVIVFQLARDFLAWWDEHGRHDIPWKIEGLPVSQIPTAFGLPK